MFVLSLKYAEICYLFPTLWIFLGNINVFKKFRDSRNCLLKLWEGGLEGLGGKSYKGTWGICWWYWVFLLFWHVASSDIPQFFFLIHSPVSGSSLVSQTVKRLPTMLETWVWSLGWEDPLEKEMATPPVFFFGESHRQRSLTDYSPWGRKELNMTEAT